MMKVKTSSSKKLSTIRSKLSFRRRNKTDDDDDLLSLSGMEPLNPSPLNSTPNMGVSRSNRSLLKGKNSSNSNSSNKRSPMTPNNLQQHSNHTHSNQPQSITIKTTTTPSSRSLSRTPRKQKSKREKYGNSIQTPSPSTPFADDALSSSGRSIVSSTNSKINQRRENRDIMSPSSQRDFNRMVHAAAALDNAANDLFAKGRYDQALTSYTRALQLKKRSLKFGVLVPESDNAQQLLASVATSINNIGYLRQRNGGGTSQEVMAAYQDSLQIKREILGKDDLSVGKTLNNIGSVYFGTRQYAKALGAYTEACGILTLQLGETHLDVATVHSNVGDVHLAQRRLQDAGSEYAIALKIRWSQLPDVNPKVVRLLEKIAAIDMADTPEKMEEIQLADDQDFIVEEGEEPVVQQFQKLRVAVQQDVTYVDQVKRKMALEMIRDKIQMIREMRELESGASYASHDHEDYQFESPVSLTASEREQALTEIKERVETMKRRKSSTRPSARQYLNVSNRSFSKTTTGDSDRIERARGSSSKSLGEDQKQEHTKTPVKDLQSKFEAAAIS